MAAASLTNLYARHTIGALYDFAVHGGAVGAIGLRVRIPAGAIIVNSFAKVITAPTGASATIAVHVEAANDIFTAAAISGAPWSTTGMKLGSPRYTPVIDLGAGNGSDTSIDESLEVVTTTVERELTLTVGTAALTAGKINFFIEYVINAAA